MVLKCSLDIFNSPATGRENTLCGQEKALTVELRIDRVDRFVSETNSVAVVAVIVDDDVLHVLSGLVVEPGLPSTFEGSSRSRSPSVLFSWFRGANGDGESLW